MKPQSGAAQTWSGRRTGVGWSCVGNPSNKARQRTVQEALSLIEDKRNIGRRSRILNCMFVLFAIATVASPRHGSQTGTGNCLSAGLAGAKRSMPDSSEGVLNCSVKPQVSLMQMDLKVRCGIRIRLVDGIALLAPSGWNRTLRVPRL